MIVIHPLKIAFEDVPKVGSTSLFTWLYSLLFNSEYIPIKQGKKTIYIHGWFKSQQNDLIENIDLEKFICPKDYFVFCLIRDPVKRLLSAYSNRVLYHNELNLLKTIEVDDKKHKQILASRPSLNYFVENLEEYKRISGPIRSHTKSLVEHLGKNLSIYHKIYDISEINNLRDALLSHWKHNDILKNKEIPSIPHLQSEGRKVFIADLTERNLLYCLRLYADDYNTFNKLDFSSAIDSYFQSKKYYLVNLNTAKIVKHKLPSYIESLIIHKSELDINNGVLDTFHGVLLLKDNELINYQLIASDSRGEWRLEWFLSSPGMIDKFPLNPHASNARFVVRNLTINNVDQVRLFVDNGFGERDIVCTIEASQ